MGFQEIDPNARTLSITVQCVHCGAKFPSPIFIARYGAFVSSHFSGNTVQCPGCGAMTGCNKGNFVARFDGGGFVGNSTI